MATDRDEAIRALMEFGRAYEQRRAAISAESQALQDERDRAIRAAFASGITTREIAKHIGLSHQRVAQIILQR